LPILFAANFPFRNAKTIICILKHKDSEFFVFIAQFAILKTSFLLIHYIIKQLLSNLNKQVLPKIAILGQAFFAFNL
jgi:hypothetical protein